MTFFKCHFSCMKKSLLIKAVCNWARRALLGAKRSTREAREARYAPDARSARGAERARREAPGAAGGPRPAQRGSYLLLLGNMKSNVIFSFENPAKYFE